jgi:hypothetical protein
LIHGNYVLAMIFLSESGYAGGWGTTIVTAAPVPETNNAIAAANAPSLLVETNVA